ncbi:MAG TPA: PIN domain-containing protein [Solirubrobacteraceae bacterium]|nr:PIN domain-containing protein [Solirubrobacteraceae bacterium]
MKVVADSHAIIWQSQRSPELSEGAANALLEAEETDGVVVSVASLIDLWYVTQTTKTVTDADLAELREKIAASPELSLHPIDEDVTDATTAIPRDTLADPWDRFIVATAKVLEVPLVTRDRAIRDSGLVPTIW